MTQISKASLSRQRNTDVLIKSCGSIVLLLLVLWMVYDSHNGSTNGSHHRHHNHHQHDVHLDQFAHGIYRWKKELRSNNNNHNHYNHNNNNRWMDSHSFPHVILEDEMEEIVHPAFFFMEKDETKEEDDVVVLRVPKFWNPSNNNNNNNNDENNSIRQTLGSYGQRRMTRFEAESVGSTMTLRGGEEMETIFVGIASYRDFRCIQTLENLFERARYPQRIRVAIVDQINTSEDDDPCHVSSSTFNCDDKDNPHHHHHHALLCLYQDHVSYVSMEASLSVGPIFARHILHRMYRGEYFAMQTDAHMEFVDGWDVLAIQQWKSTNNEMAVLTVYPSNVTPDTIDVDTGTRLTHTRSYMCNSHYEEDYYDPDQSFMRHYQQPEEPPFLEHEPLLQPFYAAGFVFARGHFVIQVPYDQYLPMIFQGEEPSMGIRAFTYGYDFYAPQQSIIFHYYDKTSRKPKPQKQNNNNNNHNHHNNQPSSNIIRTFEEENEDSYNNVNKEAMKRLKGIIGTNPEVKEWNTLEQTKYGLGHVRTTQKYFSTFGIHPNNHTVEPGLCRFVQFDMHMQFTKHMHLDQMGIDYSKIHFQFQGDPDETSQEDESNDEETSQE